MRSFEIRRESFLRCLFALGLAPACIATAQAVTEYPVPTADADLGGIVSGSDGALWFTETAVHQIGRIATDGTVTEYPLPPGSAAPGDIAAGPDGNLWFTESDGVANFRIGRMTTSGTVTEFPLPADHNPGAIVAGPDGNLWFAEQTHFGDFNFGAAGRISTAGVFDDFLLDPGFVTAMAAGPDGNIWFAQPFYTHRGPFFPLLGRITPAGEVTSFYFLQSPGPLAAGPDGNLWLGVVDPFSSSPSVLRFSTQGVLTATFLLSARAFALTSGPDGALWFLDSANRIGRITVDGGLSSYAVPTPDSGLRDLAAGPDGAIWFTEYAANQIGRIVPQAPTPTPLPPLPTLTPTPTPTPNPGGGSATVPAMSPVSVFALVLGLAAAGLWINRSR